MERTFKKLALLWLLVIANILTSQSQEMNVTSTENHQKLMSSFVSLLDQSSNYKNFKVIDRSGISSFQSDLNSFISSAQNFTNENKLKIQEKNNRISSLESELTELKNLNTDLANQKNALSFLGISVNKSVYNIILWTLLIGFAVLGAILFLKFKRANEITESSKTILKDLEDEYECYRGACIEREMNLKRQLFNESKKLQELKNAS
ncbi:MAG: hypothetical protein IE891_11135 [Flavobacteriaceae bacterium]|nr:hypothetical protein [Flavobacteriaceae bacterium]